MVNTQETCRIIWNCDNTECSKNEAKKEYKMIYWRSTKYGLRYTLCDRCVKANLYDENQDNQNSTTSTIASHSRSRESNQAIVPRRQLATIGARKSAPAC